MDALNNKKHMNKSQNLSRIFHSALRSIVPTSTRNKKSPVYEEKHFKSPVLDGDSAHLHKEENPLSSNQFQVHHHIGMGSKVPKPDFEISNNRQLADSNYSPFSSHSTFPVSSDDMKSSFDRGQGAGIVNVSFTQSSSVTCNDEPVYLNSAYIPVATETFVHSDTSTAPYTHMVDYSKPSVFSQMSYFATAQKYSSESPCSVNPPKPLAKSEVVQDNYDPSLLARIANEDDEELPWDSSKVFNPILEGSSSKKKHNSHNSVHQRLRTDSSNFENSQFLVYPKVISPKRKNGEDDDETKRVRTLSGSFRVGYETNISRNVLNYDSPKMGKYKSRSLKKSGEYFTESSQRSSHSTPRQRLRLYSEDNEAHNVSTLDSPTVKYYNSGHSPILRNYVPQYDVPTDLPEDCTFVDTHCHLDFLFKRAQHQGSFASYREKLKEYFPQNFESCVSVFCDPTTFKQKWFWKPLIDESGVWAAFGCHPHHAKKYNEEIDEALLNALEHTHVKALGEIGLDYSYKNNCDKKIQMVVFKRQINIALSKNLPLVIHCREAHNDGIEIMKEMVPRNHLIHLHCFTDSWELAKEWLDAFPNLFIGITNVVTYPNATSVHEVVKKLPLDRLLLETDSPYFLPRTMPRSLKWSHPGMAIHVAAQIAALRRTVTLKEVLRASRANTKMMYSI